MSLVGGETSPKSRAKFATIRLERVLFQGFQSPNRVAEVIFSKDSTSVIYGDNGCGKTTFLKLIHGVLNCNSSTLQKEGVIKAEIDYTVDDSEVFKVTISRYQDSNIGGVSDNSTSEDSLDQIYDWSDFLACPLSASTSLSMGVERGITARTGAIDVTDIARYIQTSGLKDVSRLKTENFAEGLAIYLRKCQALRSRSNSEGFDLDISHPYLQNIKIDNIEALLLERYREARNIATGKIQNALFDTLAAAIEQREQGQADKIRPPVKFGELILKSKERIIEALKDGSENKFKLRVISFLENFKSADEVKELVENDILCQLVINMTTELQIERQLLSAITIFVDTFNSFLTENKELFVTKNELYVDADGEKHSINVLSSGERHIFTFLALIVVAGRPRDFIFIDEPEISLNMQWQRTLLGLLTKIAPDTQIIVASHSPAIANKMPMSLVELKPTKVAINE